MLTFFNNDQGKINYIYKTELNAADYLRMF